MATISNSDIVDLNKYFKLNHDGLVACSEGCDDLTVNLFKDYAAAGKNNFVRYMAGHRTKYDNGTEYMPKQLMHLSLSKYTNLMHNKQWGALLPDQEKIVLLSQPRSRPSRTTT